MRGDGASALKRQFPSLAVSNPMKPTITTIMKPTLTILTTLLLLSPLAVLHAQQERAATMKNAFIINEDNSHFYSSRPAEDMTLKGLNAFVDQYAGTAVTHLFLCPNAMRASFRSSTREAIWDVIPSQEEIPERRRRWPDNARLLHKRGLDPYAVWIARAARRASRSRRSLSTTMEEVTSTHRKSGGRSISTAWSVLSCSARPESTPMTSPAVRGLTIL